MSKVTNEKSRNPEDIRDNISLLPIGEAGWPTLNRGGKLSEQNEHEKENRLNFFDGLSDDKIAVVIAFAEALRAPSLPSAAPEKYADRVDRSEGAIDFIKRVYAPYMASGLPRAHLRKIDIKLYEALRNWLRSRELPGDVNLPKSTDQFDRMAEYLLKNAIDPSDVASRLYTIAQRLNTRSPS